MAKRNHNTNQEWFCVCCNKIRVHAIPQNSKQMSEPSEFERSEFFELCDTLGNIADDLKIVEKWVITESGRRSAQRLEGGVNESEPEA